MFPNRILGMLVEGDLWLLARTLLCQRPRPSRSSPTTVVYASRAPISPHNASPPSGDSAQISRKALRGPSETQMPTESSSTRPAHVRSVLALPNLTTPSYRTRTLPTLPSAQGFRTFLFRDRDVFEPAVETDRSDALAENRRMMVPETEITWRRVSGTYFARLLCF